MGSIQVDDVLLVAKSIRVSYLIQNYLFFVIRVLKQCFYFFEKLD